MRPQSSRPRSRRQLRWAAGVATALVVAAALPASAGGRTTNLWDALRGSETPSGGSTSSTTARTAAAADDGHGHDHGDPGSKNDLARGGEMSASTRDPSTAAELRAGVEHVERERALPDPELTTYDFERPRTQVPDDRYAMANGCYTLATGDGYLSVDDAGAATAAAVPREDAVPLYFKATDLGSYLLFGAGARFLAGKRAVTFVHRPSVDAEWTARAAAGGFTFTLPGGRGLTAHDDGSLTLGSTPTPFALEVTERCDAFPEAQVDVSGLPHAGVTPFQEVRGYVDAHTHGMAFEFLGGRVHCGRPWHPYGVEFALRDCPDHELTGGKGAVLETFLSGEPSHDPVGWPTFRDWPAPNSLTHEGTYYRWLERSWRGGQRLLVNLLVENNKLCQAYPLKKNSCDDMDSVRLQAKRMYELQDYVDAQSGGPGRGFYRIVTDPVQAREVINQGRLAVVMGIETSLPFGCTYKRVLGRDVPACNAADIDRSLDELHGLGVRQVELVNKFDNAMTGVAGDAGEVGVVVNGANFLETLSFWDMQHCEPADGESADKTQLAFPEISAEQQDALFGAIGQLFGPVLPAVPLYGRPMHCNRRGLTGLGDHAVNALVDRRMIFDPDHMSVKARKAALDVIEARDYSGVVSSHSWATPDAYPRVYEAGGFITPYAGDSSGFVDKWRRHLGWADERYYFGFGYGADINGLGAQGDPRGADVPNPVSYPFTGLGGVTLDKQRAGERVYDINVDGVAQYGLYPDWIEDLRQLAGGEGDAIVDDMARGTEAYLQMWERAQGIAPDSCRNPELRRSVQRLRDLVRPGMTTTEVLRAVGQPYTRLGSAYETCATAGSSQTTVRIEFDGAGRVTRLRVQP